MWRYSQKSCLRTKKGGLWRNQPRQHHKLRFPASSTVRGETSISEATQTLVPHFIQPVSLPVSCPHAPTRLPRLSPGSGRRAGNADRRPHWAKLTCTTSSDSSSAASDHGGHVFQCRESRTPSTLSSKSLIGMWLSHFKVQVLSASWQIEDFLDRKKP